MTVVGVAGLTAKFAQCLIKALQEYPDVTIRGFCRSPKKLPQAALDRYNIDIVQGEYDDENAAQAFARGCDILICCYYGDDDVMTRGQKVLIDACVKEGVPRYVPSDFSVDYTKIPDGELFPKESTKIIKKYLVEKKVMGVHVLVGALMETFWSPFFHIFDSSNATISYWGTGNEKWELTTYETAAAYTAALIVDKNASGVFRFRGDCKSVVEIKESYERFYQSSLHLKHLGSLDELYSTVKSQFEKHPNDAMTWAPECFAYWCMNGIAILGDNLDSQEYPNVVTTDLDGFFRSHKKEDIPTADQRLGF
ncbi:hypothetical protein HG530_006506 [Fusarium avenaceum]|nr:hypothetical protein HG530_006506 [Fusarium avenaceum]